MKATVQSIEHLLKNRHRHGYGDNELFLSAMDLAGKDVTLTNIEYGDDGIKHAAVRELKDDDFEWYPWMFSKFPKCTKPKTVRFLHDEEVDDNSEFEVHTTGDVGVGCALVSFENIEHIYKHAVAARQKATTFDPSSKPRTPRKAARKKRRRA